MLAIFRREFKSYFINMTGYIFIGVMLLFAGIFSTAVNLLSSYASFEYVLSNLSIVLMLIVPVLCMRSISEDKRTRTDQLLYALPVSVTSVVLGKYLAMAAVWGITCLAMGVIPVILSFFGTVHFGATYAALFGFFLLGCALIAVCMYLSSLTESQLVAAVLGVGASLAIFLMDQLVSMIPATPLASFIGFVIIAAVLALIVYVMTKNYWVAFGVAALCVVPLCVTYMVDKYLFEGALPSVVSYLAMFSRFEKFLSGVFDLTAVIYFLSFAVFFVYLTVKSMDKKRWS